MSFSQINSLPGANGPAATNVFETAFTPQQESFGLNAGGARTLLRPIDNAQSQYPGQPGQYAYSSGSGNSGNGLGGVLGGLASLMSDMMNELQQMLGYLSGGGHVSKQTAFGDATISSTGDPHLAVTGTSINGSTLDGHFDNMQSHGDLIDSDSFDGGLKISTQTTTPNANGITYNKTATITSNYGQNAVSMDASGTPTVTSNGQQISLVAGQPVTLDGGETVTKNTDGSVTVVNDNGQGGTVTTTLRSNGAGVDVTATGHDVDLGGYVVNKQERDHGWSTLGGRQVTPDEEPYRSPSVTAYTPSNDGWNTLAPNTRAPEQHTIPPNLPPGNMY